MGHRARPARGRLARGAGAPRRRRGAADGMTRERTDRGRDPRRRAGDVRALRADPRLARRPRGRPRDAARDPGARPAPVLPAPARPRRLAARLPRPRRRDRPARLPPPRASGRRPDAEFAGLDAGRRRRRASPPAGGCSRSPASSRAGSSPPRTPTRLRCATSCAAGFDWWATLLRFVGRDRAALAPAVALRRSPLAVRAAALASGRVLRLDLHPADFDRPAPRARARVRPARGAPPHRGDLRRPVLIRPRGPRVAPGG